MTSSVRNERHLCWTGPEDSSVNSVLFLTGGADATLTDPRPLALLRQGRAAGPQPRLFLLDYGARMYDPTLARGLEVQETINDLSYSRNIPIFAAA